MGRCPRPYRALIDRQICQDKQNKSPIEIAISLIKPCGEAGSFLSNPPLAERQTDRQTDRRSHVQDLRRGPLGRRAGRRGLRPGADPRRPHRRLLPGNVGKLQVRICEPQLSNYMRSIQLFVQIRGPLHTVLNGSISDS